MFSASSTEIQLPYGLGVEMPLLEDLKHLLDVELLLDVLQSVPERLALQLSLLQSLDGLGELNGIATDGSWWCSSCCPKPLDLNLGRLELLLLLTIDLGPLVLLIRHPSIQLRIFLNESSAQPLRLLLESTHVRLMRPALVQSLQLFL